MSDPADLDTTAAHPGELLGRYRVVAFVNRGGMGAVYRAVDPELGREVAIKVLPAELARDPGRRERFEREYRTLGKLDHPNVVRVYDVGRHDGTPFLVMELAAGGSTADRVKAGPLPWAEATRLIAETCRGLAAAHAAGVIHRDIKPGNILIAADGTAKLADFGLVRFADPTDATPASAQMLVGTPHYMSPEQCRREPLDERSDVYSLGATYYALLTGLPPFLAADPLEVMFAHCSADAPDPRAAQPEIPAACADIVRRAMSKLPSDRYGSAGEMQAALAAAGSRQSAAGSRQQARPLVPADGSATARPEMSGRGRARPDPTTRERAVADAPTKAADRTAHDARPTKSVARRLKPRRSRSLLPIVAIAAGVIVLGVGGTLGVLALRGTPAATSPVAAAPPSVASTSGSPPSTRASTPAARPTSRANPPTSPAAPPVAPVAGRSRPQAVGEPVTALTFQPGNSNRLAWGTASGLLVDSDRGVERMRYRGAVEVRAVVYAMGGTHCQAALADGGLLTMDLSGKSAPYTKGRPDIGGDVTALAVWGSDSFIAGLGNAPGRGAGFRAWSNRGSSPEGNLRQWPGPVWALAVSGGRLFAGGDGELQVGDPAAAQAPAAHRLAGLNRVAHLAAFADGQQVAASDGTQLAVWQLGNAGPVRVLVPQGEIGALAVSADGRWLAAGDGKAVRVWSLSDGKERMNCQDHTAAVRALAFAPGGKQLVSGSLDGTLRYWEPSAWGGDQP